MFGALKSIVSPLLSGVGHFIKKNVMNNALGLATDVMTDVMSGTKVKQSLLNRGKQRGLQVLKQTFRDVSGMPVRRRTVRKKKTFGKKQRGSGKRKKRASKPSRNVVLLGNQLPRRNVVV